LARFFFFFFATLTFSTEFFQTLAFAFQPLFRWNSTIVDPWRSFLFFFHTSSIIPVDSLAAYLAAMFIVAGTLALAAFVGWQFAEKKFKAPWAVRLLRSVASFVTTVLCFAFFFLHFNPASDIPLLVVLFTVFTCPDYTGNLCPLAASFTGLLGLLFITVGLVVSSTFFPPDVTSDTPRARPHARVDLARVAIRTTLTILLVLVGTLESSRWFQAFFVALGALFLWYLHVWFQPYYNRFFRPFSIWFDGYLCLGWSSGHLH
jgi:hypothetical protein